MGGDRSPQPAGRRSPHSPTGPWPRGHRWGTTRLAWRRFDVAAAMGDDRLAGLAAEAQRVAVAGGYRLELRRLADLAARLGGPAPR